MKPLNGLGPMGVGTPVPGFREKYGHLGKSVKPKTDKYVRMDLDWVIRASRLRGCALQVGVKLWYLAGITRSLTVRLNLSGLDDQQVPHATASRALASLAKAGLIVVEREPGRAPVVTIIIANSEAQASLEESHGRI